MMRERWENDVKAPTFVLCQQWKHAKIFCGINLKMMLISIFIKNMKIWEHFEQISKNIFCFVLTKMINFPHLQGNANNLHSETKQIGVYDEERETKTCKFYDV